jgi:hypothetical protein
MPIESCGVSLALPLSNGVKDAGTGLVRVSLDGGGCGDAGEGDESHCGRRTSAVPLDCGGDFGSAGADSLEEYE